MSDEWPVKTLKEICSLITDGTHNSPKYVEAGVPMLDSKHIKNDFTIDDRRATKFITRETDNELSKRCKPLAGDVLVSSRGTIGKIAIVKSGQDFDLMGNIILLRTPENMLDRYIAYSLLSKLVEIQAISRGVAQKGLYLNQIRTFEVGFPEVAEQKRIVAILDEAFAGIDTAIANTEKNLANARELFESYLNLVFAERGEGVDEKLLGDLGKITSSKRIFKNEYVKEGIPFYRTKEIKELANKRKVTTELFIEPARYNEIREKHGAPTGGDILMTAIGTIGEIYVVKPDEVFYFKDGNVLWLKDFSEVEPYYLKYALMSFVGEFARMSHGAAYNALPIEKLKNHLVPIPSKQEQKKVIDKLDALQIESYRLQVIYQRKLEALNELKQSLLQKAFSGELTAEGDKLMDEAVA